MNIDFLPGNLSLELKKQIIDDFSFEITKTIINIKRDSDISYLNYNKSCLFDTYVYIWYIIYSLLTVKDYCEYKQKTYNMILEEAGETICNILDLSTENTKKVLKSRFAFYENLFGQKQNAPLGEKMQCVSEEFVLIIQMDIVVGTIQSYGNDSPVYVTDYEILSKTQSEVISLSDVIMINIFSKIKKDKASVLTKTRQRLCGTPTLKSENEKQTVKKHNQKTDKEMSPEKKLYRFCSGICFMLVFIFLLSILNMPTFFYTFMRWVVFLSSIYLVLTYYSEKVTDEAFRLFVFTIFVAILWNPIIPFHCNKNSWIILDVFASILMLYSGVRNFRHKKY